LGPARGFQGDPEVADSNGRILGHAALAALEHLPPPSQQWTYEGPVISGATIGAWNWSDTAPDRRTQASCFASQTVVVPLPYRAPWTREQISADLADGRQRLHEAAAATDELELRDARSRVERLQRRLRILESTPSEGEVDFEIRLWRLGEGVILLMGGEPYQQLQVSLRHRFPNTALVIVSLCNRLHSYLLPRDRYGLGLYQEEICTLAPGCLEAVEEAAAQALESWGFQ
jgi:hypothetical protein